MDDAALLLQRRGADGEPGTLGTVLPHEALRLREEQSRYARTAADRCHVYLLDLVGDPSDEPCQRVIEDRDQIWGYVFQVAVAPSTAPDVHYRLCARRGSRARG